MDSQNDPSEPLCPYCRVPTGGSIDCCPSCKVRFPWATQVEQLRSEMKERETNRLRATYTLVSEAFEHATGGRPMTAAAVKGMINALILPRAMILFGSLLGVLFVGLQTYVIWTQTRLLAQQAEAARVEQADRLRDRIARASVRVDEIDQIAKHLPPSSQSKCDDECRSSKWTEIADSVLSITRDELEIFSMGFMPTRKTSKQSPDIAKMQWPLHVFVAAASLNDARVAVRALRREPSEPPNSQRDATTPIESVLSSLTPAMIQCLPDRQAMARLTQDARGLERLATALGPVPLDADTAVGVQGIRNSVLLEALADAPTEAGLLARWRQDRRSHDVELGVAMDKVQAMLTSVRLGIESLAASCRAVVERDSNTLQAIEDEPRTPRAARSTSSAPTDPSR